MKYLLLFVAFLLVFISCKKEGNSPIRNHEFGNCLKDEEPIDFTLTSCNLRELDTLQYCELITSTSYFPLSEEAGDLLPYYCCEQGDTILFVNAQGETTNLSIFHKGRGKLFVQPTTKCEQDSSKMKLRCVNFETDRYFYNNSLIGTETFCKYLA
ncbi:MAG: hypothetical protein R3E32_28830 [Chitinophagales bacterium]